MENVSDPEHLIRAFWEHRALLDRADAARFHASHFQYDQQILSSLCHRGSRVLDLGCGRCDIAAWLATEREAVVHGVDAEVGFVSHAPRHSRLTIEVADVRGYRPSGRFDAVLLFGVIVHLVDQEVREQLYRRISRVLGNHGFLLVKSQFGLEGPVEVNTFSEALNHHYYAVYPGLSAEVSLLSAYFDVEVLDAYPPELSPHKNTKFRHLVCRTNNATK